MKLAETAVVHLLAVSECFAVAKTVEKSLEHVAVVFVVVVVAAADAAGLLVNLVLAGIDLDACAAFGGLLAQAFDLQQHS